VGDVHRGRDRDGPTQRYEIGHVTRAVAYHRGSRAAPKLKIWGLGRRVSAQAPLVCAPPGVAHSLLAFAAGALEHHSYPIAPLMRIRETGSGLLLIDDFAYELFRFIEGERFDKSLLQSRLAGESLGALHRIASTLDASTAPPAVLP
jgi:hypothetical protein